MPAPSDHISAKTATPCPICKSPVPAAASSVQPLAPFCSDRCKLIDLGRWLDGKYQIPVTIDDDTNDPLEP